MWMMWGLLIFSLAFIVSTMLWLLPSPAQRRRMQLRQQAMQEKMKVRQVSCSLATRLGLEGDTIRYQYFFPLSGQEAWLARAAQEPEALIHWCLSARQGHWPGEWPHPDPGLESLQLDEPVKVLVTCEGVGWVWSEIGSQEDLARLIRLIRRLLEAMDKVESGKGG